MKFSKFYTLLFISFLWSCASSYQTIEPKSINYVSGSETENVKLEYKYDVLMKKYAKKEEKKDLRLIAIRITNESGQDLVFGKDVALTYENGNEIYIMENKKVFRALKQSPASYLWYLLLSPVSVYTTDSNGYEENVFPIGLILGPGLTAGNMIASGSANKKFKNELLEYNLNGTLIKNGETKHGLIGIKSNSYDALRLKVKRYSFFD